VSGLTCVQDYQLGMTCDALAPTVVSLNLALGELAAPTRNDGNEHQNLGEICAYLLRVGGLAVE
jgi:hypothetical protein